MIVLLQMIVKLLAFVILTFLYVDLYIEAAMKRKEVCDSSFADDCEAVDQLDNLSVDSGSDRSFYSSSATIHMLPVGNLVVIDHLKGLSLRHQRNTVQSSAIVTTQLGIACNHCYKAMNY